MIVENDEKAKTRRIIKWKKTIAEEIL
jgi:hypothetical protein